MKEFSHKISGRGIRPRTRRVLHPHSHRHHRFGGCGSGVTQDARRRGRGERIHAVHELHRALANVTPQGTGSCEVKPR
jgi:hypothetical protein